MLHRFVLVCNAGRCSYYCRFDSTLHQFQGCIITYYTFQFQLHMPPSLKLIYITFLIDRHPCAQFNYHSVFSLVWMICLLPCLLAPSQCHIYCCSVVGFITRMKSFLFYMFLVHLYGTLL